ncbi:MAG: hypothetical protein N2235_21570 [Fischerella sp.]|nr:hypothetical protein [Fischerella sp.]
MIISDLNLLESVEGTGVVGGSLKVDFRKKFDKIVNIKTDVVSAIKSAPAVKGNVALAEAAANAEGKDTFTDAESFTDAVEDKYSRSLANSVSAVN